MAGPDAVNRLLHSPAFTRSRRAASMLENDAVALAELLEVVRLRQVEEDPHLQPVSDRVAAAVDWLGPQVEDRLDRAGHLARRRLIIAALHYLVNVTDVLPEGAEDKNLDDIVVLRYVLGSAVESEISVHPTR